MGIGQRNLGHWVFESYITGDDPEWDVDYNFDAFEWASVGHPTAQAARSAWHGANPGGGMEYDTPSKETDRYDAMAQVYLSAYRSSFRR